MGRSRQLQLLQRQQHLCQTGHCIDAALAATPGRAARVYRTPLRRQLQPQQTTVSNTDDIAGIGVDRTIRLQTSAIQQVTNAKPAAGTRLFVHNTGDLERHIFRLQQALVPQQRQRVQTTNQAGLVVRRTPAVNAAVAHLRRKRRRAPGAGITFSDRIHVSNKQKTLGPGPPLNKRVRPLRIGGDQLGGKSQRCACFL